MRLGVMVGDADSQLKKPMNQSFKIRQDKLRSQLNAHSDGSAARKKIDRINELTRTAKGIWFGLLSYMAFVGVTLMGVNDVDFFLPERQTTLPLVNVPVPTFLFMTIAPVLGAVLYSYFHMHLLKHWEASASADPVIEGAPLSDYITPWLVTDFALAMRKNGSLRERPLENWTNTVNIAFVFLGTPLLLIAFWFRSAVPHYEWLTLLVCGGSLIASVVVGVSSWRRLKHLCEDPFAKVQPLSRKSKRRLWGFVLALTLLGWFRVEGTLEQYARDMGLSNTAISVAGSIGTPMHFLLSKANLEGVNFAKAPVEWREPDLDKAVYRKKWCAEIGLPTSVCVIAVKNRNSQSKANGFAMRKWCSSLSDGNLTMPDCYEILAEYENRFGEDWKEQWETKINNLEDFDFNSADLRYAKLSRANLQNSDMANARLQGAVLDEAQLQGADLANAQLQGAALFAAQMQGAILDGAHLFEARLFSTQLQGAFLNRAQMPGAFFADAMLQGAFLEKAQMQKANFKKAQLQGAVLDKAQLQGADLSGALLKGASLLDAHLQETILTQTQLNDANLDGAQLQGAFLLQTSMNQDTDLSDAALRGAAFRSVDFSKVNLTQGQVDEVFFDASVILPDHIEPSSRIELVYVKDEDFIAAWRAWQATNGYGSER